MFKGVTSPKLLTHLVLALGRHDVVSLLDVLVVVVSVVGLEPVEVTEHSFT